EKYGFTPTQEWIDHIRLSAVRFSDGGSGSFISPNGLVMTNHHVGLGQIAKLSTPEMDLVKDGFLAGSMEKELKCPDLELNILVKMTNVTDKVKAAEGMGMDAAKAAEARQQAIARMEKAVSEESGNRADVISFYNGGEYWLYEFKKYTDVRLVFAPESQAAAFGGDLDNFTYPRWCLDVSLFRAYEDGKPVESKNFLKWNNNGPKADELVFVAGNPGRTDRDNTYAQLTYSRDYSYPQIVEYLDRAMDALNAYAAQGPEQARQAESMLRGMANSQKAYGGMYKGLLNEKIMAQKLSDEKAFREKVAANPTWEAAYGSAWTDLEKLYQTYAAEMKAGFFKRPPRSRLQNTALGIVRYVEEVSKPNEERLDGYRDNQLEGAKFRLLSKAPIFPELEARMTLVNWSMMEEVLGKDNQLVKTILDGKSVEEAVKKLYTDSKLLDVDYRKKLLEGGKKAVAKSKDPLVQLMLKLDPIYRAYDKWSEETIDPVRTAALEKIAAARFAVYGKSLYPDANFNLRLSYGTVQGFAMNGTEAPPFNTIYGLYDRAIGFGNTGEFELPARFWDRKAQLDMATPVNLVSTNDVVGGNSGSPLINSKGEVVGLIFDGNIESLVGRFIYDIETNRTVSVHTAYIMEALNKLYDASYIANEIRGGEITSTK
ncbi:MAG: S46 family peptidase, partial [Calditrichaeota bacterium]|nr:S46 family peptidase [Calditrichota bacterium]